MDTLFVGQNLIQLSEVGSTNTYAISLLQSTKPAEGTVIYAKKQTNGKGQRGNSWLSEPLMNLTVTAIFYPSFLQVNNHFYLSKITALALHDVLSEALNTSQHDIRIKWPNDILVDKRKIAGVLIENAFRSSAIVQSVIGIGLNVNQSDFGALQHTATSLYNITGQFIDPKDLLALLCKYLEKWYMQVRKGSYDRINANYLEHLYWRNEWKQFEQEGGKVLKGRISNVAENGQLILELESGLMKGFEVKEISFLHEMNRE